MHELPVLNRIMDICRRHALANNANKIVIIELKIGALSDLDPEWMQRYFDFISRNTIAEGATLQIEKTPITYRCGSCKNEYEVDMTGGESSCPECRGKEVYLISGNSYFISNIKVI